MWQVFKAFALALGFLCIGAAPVSAQPRVRSNGVVNHGSYAQFGFMNSGIAQGSLFAVFGEDLGPAVSTLITADGFPLRATLAGVSIRVTVNETSVDALPVYVSARRLGALLPSSTPLGAGSLTVRFQEQTSAPVPINVVRRNFGIFTRNGAGSGPALVQDSQSSAVGPPRRRRANAQALSTSMLGSARPGQVVTIYGTGLGPVTGAEDSHALPGDLAIPVTVFVGSRVAQVTYAGRVGADCCPMLRSSGFTTPAGLDEVAFIVPDGVEGCYVPVGVVAGADRTYPDRIHPEGVMGNHATISISPDGGTCNDPTGLTGAEIHLLQQRDKPHIGVISLSRSFALGGGPPPEIAVADFRRYDPLAFMASSGVFGLPAVGTCLWVQELPSEGLPRDPVQPPRTHSGTTLSLTGPNGARQLTRDSAGRYTAILESDSSDHPAYLVPGPYTLDNGNGGADVGPFRVDFTIPSPVVWTNRKSFVQGDPPFSLTWSGGDPGSFVVMSALFATDFAGGQLLCVAENAAGRLTIPQILWRGNATVQVGGVFGSQAYVVAIGSLAAPRRFSAQGLDTGLVTSVVFTDAVYR